MREFCKILNSDEYGQILVMIELSDNSYDVNLLFNADFGTAKVELSRFKLIEHAEKYFKSIEIDEAENIVQSVLDNL